MTFTTTIPGYITGVRFFKSANNLGTHVGNLWAANGTHLAQVNFSAETPTGWQTAYFPSPIAVLANTTYIISYHAPQGRNAADNGAFTTAVTSLPLQAPADAINAPNGVYKTGATGFPTTGASATNYWVDAIFHTAAVIGTLPPVSLFSPGSVPKTPETGSTQAAELGVRFMPSIPGYATGLLFYKGTKNLGQHIGHLWTSTGTLLTAVTFTNETASGWQQANFSAPVALTANTVYIISYWAPKGRYADDAQYFATLGVTSQMLYAPPNGQYGPNGSYANNMAFPTSSSNSSNYWVDIVFTTALQ